MSDVIRQNLERLLKKHDIGHVALGARIGKNATLVRDILQGKSRNPQHASLVKIAQALGEPVDALTDPLGASAEPDPFGKRLSRLSAQDQSIVLGMLERLEQVAEASVGQQEASSALGHPEKDP